MGVVSGIVMPFQFGTNWSRFSDATANIISPLLAYEGLTAFFLEATLSRRAAVRPQAGAAVGASSSRPLMVAVGTLFSSFWILAANSWMQTPAGYEIVDGRFFPTDWFAIIFNPSFPYRLSPHGDRLLRDDRLRRARRRGALSAGADVRPPRRA